MPRKIKAPSLRFHKPSAQYLVSWSGGYRYLGKEVEAARDGYRVALSDWAREVGGGTAEYVSAARAAVALSYGQPETSEHCEPRALSPRQAPRQTRSPQPSKPSAPTVAEVAAALCSSLTCSEAARKNVAFELLPALSLFGSRPIDSLSAADFLALKAKVLSNASATYQKQRLQSFRRLLSFAWELNTSKSPTGSGSSKGLRQALANVEPFRRLRLRNSLEKSRR